MQDNNIFDKIFPKKYNFYSMLFEQSKNTYNGIHALEKWIENKQESDYEDILMYKSQADKIRFQLEGDLTEAFIIPFDRQDLYSISIEINKIMECTKSAGKTIKALNIQEDSIMLEMIQFLSKGALELTAAIAILESNPNESKSKIASIRMSQNSMEEIYITGLCQLFTSNDVIMILKYREIYNNLKEAAMFLGNTVDIYHRICVRML